MHAVDERSQDYVEFTIGNHLPRPPRLSIDVDLKVALYWEAEKRCVVAHALESCECHSVSGVIPLRDVNLDDAHVLCDMDAASVGCVASRHGSVWLFSNRRTGVWTSSRKRY
eukprot:TRINITY_DN67373_c0_g1_i1.p1 TRINITY_DN67373_c0_g1~~TRINITY_DN67373_c0_g1_i1.p1  ORF type:complete len:112 (-),score=4.81 TRINITY_DN67373_c0_g1_i1:55-390(-)